MTAASAAPGMPAGVQLAAVLKLLLTAFFQWKVAMA
jgi:hypothetical protein